jgi:trigger factor
MAQAATDQLKVTTHPAERSSVVLEVELPAERVRRSVEQSVRHLARRTKVPGFRPGKAPRPLLERALGVRVDDPAANPLYQDAKEHLFEDSVVEAVRGQDLAQALALGLVVAGDEHAVVEGLHRHDELQAS